MGILNFETNTNTKTNDNNKKDLVPAEFWLNPGYDSNPEDPENNRFITIPFGIPLDTMSPLTYKGSSEETVDVRDQRNQLLADLLEACQDLEPGEEKVVNLTLKVRRVSKPIEVATGESKFARKTGPLIG